jgi:hypothetical protein
MITAYASPPLIGPNNWPMVSKIRHAVDRSKRMPMKVNGMAAAFHLDMTPLQNGRAKFSRFQRSA